MNTPLEPTPSAWAAVATATPTVQANLVAQLWAADRNLEPSSARRLGDLLARFAARLEATGVPSLTAATQADCEGFVWAPGRTTPSPALHTVHLRRTTLRTLYRTLHQLTGDDHDPTRHLELPPRTRQPVRPVTDDEIHLLRAAALARSRNRDRTIATLALAEATATSSEIPQVRWEDLDLTTGTVDLAGAHPIRPRTGHLSIWGIAVLTNIAHRTDPDPVRSLTYRGTAGSDSHAGQAQTSGQLRRLLDDAGLTDPDLRPGSIRLWQPAATLAGGARIEHVARLLGVTSLDTAAAMLGHDWQADR